MVVDKVTGCGYTAVAGYADTATTSTIKNCKDGDVLHFTGNYLQHAGVRLRPLCDGWHASDICRNMRSFRHSLILLVVTFKSGYGEGPKCTGVWKKDKQVMCTLGAMDGVYGLWDIYVNDEQTGLQLQGHEPEVTKLGGCLKVSGPLDAVLLARGTRLTLGGALTPRMPWLMTVRVRPIGMLLNFFWGKPVWSRHSKSSPVEALGSPSAVRSTVGRWIGREHYVRGNHWMPRYTVRTIHGHVLRTQKSDITTVRTRLRMLLPSVPWTSQPLPALFRRC